MIKWKMSSETWSRQTWPENKSKLRPEFNKLNQVVIDIDLSDNMYGNSKNSFFSACVIHDLYDILPDFLFGNVE